MPWRGAGSALLKASASRTGPYVACPQRQAEHQGVSGRQGVNDQRPYVAGAVPAEGLVSKMEPHACPEPQSKHQGASGCQGVNQ